MFTDLPTLHNCFMFGNVSNGGSETAAKLQLINELNATANNVARVLDDCLTNYCHTIPDCMGASKSYMDLPSLWSDSSYGFTNFSGKGPTLVDSICSNVPWRINSDVGGIGIYVSYWIQTGLAFLGLIGTLFWKWIIPHGHYCFQAFNHGLVAALTDFHKAQCFFMLAINIAALVVIQRGGFDPQSLQQMYDTYVFLQVLAVNGFLPITFTLTNLYLVGMLSWFLILLSFVTIALSVATLACVGQFNPSVADMTSLAELAASGGPEECDGRKPGIYCLRTMEYNFGVDYFYGGQNIPNYAYTILSKKPSSMRYSARRAKLRSTRAWRFYTESASIVHQQVQTLSWQSLLKLAFGAAIYVVLLTFYVRFYNMYLHDLAWFAENDINGNTWNFGQVFAITVWVPPIVEYIHLELRGMHRAFDHRLLPPFRISRTPTPNPAPELESINILPPKTENSDLESGNKGSSAPIEPVTSRSPSSASPSSPADDDEIGNATTMEAYDDLDDDDIAHQDHYDESNGYHLTDQPDSIIPLQSYGNGHASGDQDTERLLPPLDFSGDGTNFSSISL
ncbi:MAG: hypothetical protein Q9176_005389 [Flavoplaca citrina]